MDSSESDQQIEPDWQGSGVELFSTQRRLLEAMFSDGGLGDLRSSDPLHPAVLRFGALGEMVREGERIAFPFQHLAIVEGLRQVIDTANWAPEEITDDFWSFLDDDDVRIKTTAALRDAGQFLDTLAELSIWGFLRNAGLEARRVEEEGLSDIVIDEGGDAEVRGDVKRIRRSSAVSRVGEVIQKANKQVKKSEPQGGGAVFILLDVPLRAAPSDDGVPQVVSHYAREARAAIRQHNSSINHVVLVWDDYVTHGNFPDPVMYALRRRSIVLEHSAPRVSARLHAQQLEIGQTLVTTIKPDPAPRPRQDPPGLLRALRLITTSDQQLGRIGEFAMEPGLSDAGAAGIVIAKRHVRNTLDAPDAVAIHYILELTSAVIVKRVRTATVDFVLAVLASWDDRKAQWRVSDAYKLFDEEDALDRLASDANEAFVAVLERYGCWLKVGNVVARWFPEITAQLPDDQPPTWDYVMAMLRNLGEFDRAPERARMPCSMMVSPENQLTARGVYMTDLDRYHAAVRAADRRDW
ncbi:MAG TPA: hypothetical protein VEW67_01580 [Thermoleophilaceae bacterium]|nr:hypothetical protein [Thermoleophilaceae bacterium]